MNEKLEGMLRVGREKLSAMQDEKAKMNAQAERLGNEIELREIRAVMSLVPVELHEYTTIDRVYGTISVTLPDAARATASVRLQYAWSNGDDGEKRYQYVSEAWLNKNVDGGVWRLSFYRAYEGDINWVSNNAEIYAELDVALARAIELGDGKAEAEDEAAKQRAEAEWDAVDDSADETPVRVEICPLMSTADKQQMCVLHDCAWFMRGTCIVKILAWNGDQQ